MNLIGLIIGVAILAVLGGGYAVTQKKGEEVVKDTYATGQQAIDTAKDIVADANMKDAKMMAEEKMMDAMRVVDDEKMMSGESKLSHGSYEPYASEKLEKAHDGKVVLFFRASWCPSCKTVDADIASNILSIPKGVVILDVNYDDSTALKTKYGVTYQHTFVQVDSKGTLLAKWSGSPSLADIVAHIK